MATLPIYRVNADVKSRDEVHDLYRGLFGFDGGFRTTEDADAYTVRRGHQVLQIMRQSGGIWAADESRLFNPYVNPQLPSEADAVEIARQRITELNLFSAVQGPFHFSDPVIGGTYFARRYLDGSQREEGRLDIQVTFPIMVGAYPIVGGGGDFSVTIGNQGHVLGLSGVWRPGERVHDATVVSTDTLLGTVTDALDGENFDYIDWSLAYYSAPASEEQQYMVPVYVVQLTAMVGEKHVPLRTLILPATDFGPAVPQVPSSSLQGPSVPPPPRSGTELPPRQRGDVSTRPYRVGASWIGPRVTSGANATGFVDAWKSAGWEVPFIWGGRDAFESDWNQNANDWIDNVDLAFYSGHASMDGWKFLDSPDRLLSYQEAALRPGEMWGNRDLEWMIIAACGPLQDEFISAGGGDALDRWKGAFDGLHIMMGYASTTYTTPTEGKEFASYALKGNTLIESWFRAAKSVQIAKNLSHPPNGPLIYAAAMWAGNNDIDPFNDHAWGCGSVSDDPVEPTWLAAMWTTC